MKPALIIHTGDITHLSKDAGVRRRRQILVEAGLPVLHVPGEHDMLDEGSGKAYLARFGKGTHGHGLVQLRPQRRPFRRAQSTCRTSRPAAWRISATSSSPG